MKLFIAHAQPDSIGYWKHIGFKIREKVGSGAYMIMTTSQVRSFEKNLVVKFLTKGGDDSNNHKLKIG